MHRSSLPESRLEINNFKGRLNCIVLATAFSSVGGLGKCVFAVVYSILSRPIFLVEFGSTFGHALCEVRTEALPINKGCFRKLEAWYNRIYAGESQGCREALASRSEVWAPNRVKKYIVAALRVTCNTYAHMGEITYMMKGLLDNCRLGR